MKCDKNDLLLYGGDRPHTGWRGRALYAQTSVEQSIAGGVDLGAAAGRRCCARRGCPGGSAPRSRPALPPPRRVPFVIDDDVELAAADAARTACMWAKATWKRWMCAGCSGKKPSSAFPQKPWNRRCAAQAHGADYLGVGAVFPTGSKDDAADVSMETLRAICEAVDIPVIAIGGISEDNVGQLAGSGICGIAVISAIFAQENIRDAAARLKQKTAAMLEKSGS